MSDIRRNNEIGDISHVYPPISKKATFAQPAGGPLLISMKKV